MPLGPRHPLQFTVSDGRSGSAARVSGLHWPDRSHHLQRALSARPAWHGCRHSSVTAGSAQARQLSRRRGSQIAAGQYRSASARGGRGGKAALGEGGATGARGARGFDVGPEDGKPSDKTQAAISSYEKSHGLPVTGVATDELLRHILLGDSVQQPAGATGSVDASAEDAKAKENPNVKAVQQVLADLGYAPGPVDGALGDATTRAIIAFQKDRKIAQTGRITPALLAELKRVTGRDLTKMAAGR